MTTNTTPATFPSTQPLPLTALPESYGLRVRDALSDNGVHHTTLVGHSDDVARGVAHLTVRVSLPVAFPEAWHTGLDRAAGAVATSAQFLAALDKLVGHGGVALTFDSIALNSEDVAEEEIEVEPVLTLYSVDVIRDVTFRRTMEQRAQAQVTHTVLVLANDEAEAERLAQEKVEEMDSEIEGNDAEEVLSYRERDNLDWEDHDEDETPTVHEVDGHYIDGTAEITDPTEIVHYLTDKREAMGLVVSADVEDEDAAILVTLAAAKEAIEQSKELTF